MKNRLDFSQAIKKLEKQRSDLPKQIANVAQSTFENAFKTESWDGVKWKQVKRRTPGTKEYEYPKKTDLNRRKRGILQGKNRRLFTSVKNSLREASWRQIKFGVDVPYASYHNDGTEKSGGHLARRRFMGNNRLMKGKLDKRINNAIKSIF